MLRKYVLIETLWNVNNQINNYEKSSYAVLIETLWNVNTNGYFLESLNADGFNRNIVECKFCCTAFD